jgi:hypothetical protein
LELGGASFLIYPQVVFYAPRWCAGTRKWAIRAGLFDFNSRNMKKQILERDTCGCHFFYFYLILYTSSELSLFWTLPKSRNPQVSRIF